MSNILIKQTSYNFGTIEFGQTYTKEFPLVNDTGKVIDIVKVYNGGCNCVVSSVPVKRLVPGQSTFLRVEITPGSTGFFRRTPIITFKVGIGYEQSESMELVANVK
jgi:hypothetical protein